MLIEINPRSLLNLENICEVLYKLHPSVLDYLVEMERSLGKLLGTIDLDNVSLEEREFLSDNYQEDYSSEPVSQDVKITSQSFDNIEDLNKFLDEYKSNNPNTKILTEEDSTSRLLKTIAELKKDKNSMEFHSLRKYIQLDTYEYIPIKIYVEVEDPILGRKVKELVRALEKTRAPEQFYLNEKEVDEDAYFAEGYGLTMNEEQRKQRDDFLDGEDVEGLKELLRKEKLHP